MSDVNDNKKFWKKLKPLLGNKVNKNNAITLVEGNKLITDNTKLAQMFNEFFVNSVENLAITFNFSSNLNPININDILFPYEIHASVIAIKPNMLVPNPVFTFKNANKIGAILKNLVT